MAINDCLRNMVDGGLLKEDEAAEIGRLFERKYAQLRLSLGDEAAAMAAQAELAERLRLEALHKKRVALLTIAVTDRVKREIFGYRTASGRPDIGAAVLNLLEHYGRAGYSSVAGRAKAITGQAHADMEGLLHAFDRTLFLGTRKNKAGLENVVREAFGEATGDATAKGLADAWEQVSDGLRQRFNAAGGAIGKLEKWGLPQSHDRRALLKAGIDRWKAEIKPLLDPARMLHPLTGKAVDPEELDDVLGHVWRSVVMEGWNTREAARQPFGRGALANQRTDHRFLVFKSADDWLTYQKAFGNGDPFAAMMSHINGMARDIASMEILGPNPGATITWLKQIIEKQAAEAVAGRPGYFTTGRYPGLGIDGLKAVTLHEIDGVWSELRGGGNLAVSPGFATFGAAVRNWLVAAKMGAAVLSAVPTDPAVQGAARSFMGLPAANVLWDIARQFRGASKREAVTAGLILEEAQHVLRDQARWAGSLAGPEWSKWLPDRVITLSGLSAWTRAGKHAFGRAIQAFAADQMETAWEDLPPAFRRVAEGYGIDRTDWNVMRLAEPEQIREARFLRPGDIARIVDGPALPRLEKLLGLTDEDQAARLGAARAGVRRTAEKFLEMILSETEYAVPSGTVRGRSLIVGQTKAGTFWGEFARSFAMFKAFGVSVAMLQGGRIATEIGAGRSARSGAYAGALFTTLTLGGALAAWLKDISNGRDPQKPDTPDFWFRAMAQGGGAGIFGDFLFADYNRFGNSLGATLAGPVAGAAEDAARLTLGNARELGDGKPTHAGRELVNVLRNYTPGGSLWYLRAGYNRVLLDQLQYLMDPDASKSFKTKVRNSIRERDQGFWWAPGELAPQRPPTFNGR